MRSNILKKIFFVLSAWLIVFGLLTVNLFADTLYLKNGRHVDGIIEREDKEGIELNLGFGTTTFHRSEIDRVVKSDTTEKEAIWQEWGASEKELEKRKPEEERKWRERQAEIERIRLETENLKKEQDEYGMKVIKVTAKEGQILVNALLNGEVRANLVLDSGAAVVVLTRHMADKLGIEVEGLKKSRMQVADGRWVDIGLTMLQSVKVQNVEQADPQSAKIPGVEIANVEAAVILDESLDKSKLEDGLLGMAFLKNFKFNADYKNGVVTFERMKNEESKDDGQPKKL